MAQVNALQLTRSSSDMAACFTSGSSKRRPASAIPADVWRCVFDLLPASVQAALACVNRTCLQTYRAIRYRALHLEDYGPVTKRLVRLLAEPSMAAFVREVHIRPWDISLESRRKKHHLPFRFWLGVNGVFSPAEAKRLASERSDRRARRRIKRIRSMLALTPAVRYTFEWDERPEYDHYFFAQLLHPVLSGAMRETLIHLSLKIPPATILPDRLVGIRLPALETLHLEFCLPHGQPQAMHFLEEMRIFVNAVEHQEHPHLRSLELGVTSSSDPFDLNAFFHHLGPFGALDRFQLTVPFNGTHLQDVTGLRAFLSLHARQLHRLIFRTRRMTPGAAQSNPGWVLSALRGIYFPCLLSAELALRPVVGPFNIRALAEWIQMHATGLRSLALTDRQLLLDEVVALVGALDVATVRRLKLRVRRLSVSLLQVIARALPLLRKLEVTFVDVGAVEDGTQGVVAFSEALRPLQSDFQSWQLGRLTLRQPFRTLDDHERSALVNALRCTMPSLAQVNLQMS